MAEAKGTTLVLYNLQMAAALIASAIPLLFFLVLGRYFIRGLLAGALIRVKSFPYPKKANGDVAPKGDNHVSKFEYDIDESGDECQN
jgi:hypothetical protein